jgi:hypothetical protein
MANALRVFACTRTLNESRNIDRFCRSFAWADRILIADGGSTDDTVYRALAYPNAVVRGYPVRNEASGTLWNPQGPMCQWLWDWAKEDGADWLVLEDCDCVPNTRLRTELRSIIEVNRNLVDMLVAVRVYQWGDTRQHFPSLSHTERKGEWSPNSYFAWRADLTGVKFSDAPVHQGFLPHPRQARIRLLTLTPPYCLIHRFALDEDDIAKKTLCHDAAEDFKVRHSHPMVFGGELEDMPAWATEDE